ncbi:hypothetical protein C3L33_23305, partial [Rhododendron williamsianum]
MSTSRSFFLRSSDGEIFEVPQAVAEKSQLIKSMIEANFADPEIVLEKVTGEILAKVIEYCKKHAQSASKCELKDFDSKFVRVDLACLFDVILAANYLDISSLLDLTTKRVADMLRGNTLEQVRESFNIVNDFTPMELKALKDQEKWAFK